MASEKSKLEQYMQGLTPQKSAFTEKRSTTRRGKEEHWWVPRNLKTDKERVLNKGRMLNKKQETHDTVTSMSCSLSFCKSIRGSNRRASDAQLSLDSESLKRPRRKDEGDRKDKGYQDKHSEKQEDHETHQPK